MNPANMGSQMASHQDDPASRLQGPNQSPGSSHVEASQRLGVIEAVENVVAGLETCGVGRELGEQC